FRSKAVLGSAFCTGINLRRLKTRAEFTRTADQIGMDMRLKDMGDGEPGFAGHFNINVDIGSRIEKRAHSFVIVAEQIRKLRDAFSLNSFKNEGHRRDLTQMGEEVQ